MGDCCCGGKTNLIYACSGAADVGEIADKVARRLAREGHGKMTCLAGIGAGLAGFIESAKASGENITIDGCPVACARRSLENIGVTPRSYILTDLGLVKGASPADVSTVETVKTKILLGTPCRDGKADGMSGGCTCA